MIMQKHRQSENSIKNFERFERISSLAMKYLTVKGFFLFLLGLSWVFFQSPGRQTGIAWTGIIDQVAVGLALMLSGLTAMVCAHLHGQKFPKVGFFMLIMCPTTIGLYFAISWVGYYVPVLPIEGSSRAFITAISYWTYSGSSYIISKIYASSVSSTLEVLEEARYNG